MRKWHSILSLNLQMKSVKCKNTLNSLRGSGGVEVMCVSGSLLVVMYCHNLIIHNTFIELFSVSVIFRATSNCSYNCNLWYASAADKGCNIF